MDKIDMMIELKKIAIDNEKSFSNAWELLQWYDIEQVILELFDYIKSENQSQQVSTEDKGYASPSPPPRNVNESLEGGCDEEFLAPADTFVKAELNDAILWR